MQSVPVSAPQRGSVGLGTALYSAWMHAHKHIPTFGWQTVSSYFIVLHWIIQVHVVILTYDAQLSKGQLPHFPAQQVKSGRVKRLNNHCSSYSLLHSSCPSCKALLNGLSCFSYIMAVWV